LFNCRQQGHYETKWFVPLIDVSLDDRVNVQGTITYGFINCKCRL